MYSKSSRLKSSSTSVLIRCPKDIYKTCSGVKRQQHLKTTTSRSKLTVASPTSRLTTVKDQNHDPYLLGRSTVNGDALESIHVARKKLRNLQFLESCFYSEIEKIQVKQIPRQDRNMQPLPKTLESRYQQSVTEYDTVVSNVDQLAIKIRETQQRIRQMKECQKMTMADIESQYLHRAEVLLQFEDCQQIITVYSQQFEEQNQLVLKESELSLSLKEIEHNKRTITAELEVLDVEQRQFQDDYDYDRSRYFEQKINQLRVNLLEQEAAMNLLCLKHYVPKLRELICNYYSHTKENAMPKQEQEAIEMWLCRQQLVEDFKSHVIEKQKYTKPDIFHAFKRYVDILNKIETIYKKMNSSRHQQLTYRRNTEQSDLMTQYNYWISKERQIKDELSTIKQTIQQLQTEEKLNRLQILEGGYSRQFTLTLQRLNHEHEFRIQIIKQTRERLKHLQQRLRSKVPDPISIQVKQSLRVQIDAQQATLRKLKNQYLKLDKARQQKQNEFRSVKNSRTVNKVNQDFEAVHILYKKIDRIKQKKHELNSKISDYQNKAMSFSSPKAQAQALTTERLYSSRQMTTKYGESSTCRSLSRKTHSEYHPLEETIQKLQRLKDSIVERAPVTAVYSRILKF